MNPVAVGYVGMLIEWTKKPSWSNCGEPSVDVMTWIQGLPVSRLHARYLGGQLQLTTYPGPCFLWEKHRKNHGKNHGKHANMGKHWEISWKRESVPWGFGTDVYIRLPRITSEQVEEIKLWVIWDASPSPCGGLLWWSQQLSHVQQLLLWALGQ